MLGDPAPPAADTLMLRGGSEVLMVRQFPVGKSRFTRTVQKYSPFACAGIGRTSRTLRDMC